MGAGVRVTRGVAEVGRLLREELWDVRAVDEVGFRAWLDLLMARWAGDPVFRLRATIRAARRAHPEVRRLERAYRAAVSADAAAPAAARLRQLDRAAAGAGKAVTGLAAALAHAPPDDHPRLAAKLADARGRLRALEEERARLEADSAERQSLVAADVALRRARSAAGLDRAGAELAALLAARGRRAGRAGDTFEDVVAAVAERVIRSELAGGEDAQVLRRVRLGAAGVEFDALVVRPNGSDGAADVLAAVEAKRDVNGLAHGFLRRQADLAWLTGDAGRYDPAAYRTRAFPAGHFDRAAEARAGGAVVRFGPGSFRRFRRDPGCGWFLDGLYLATRPGPLWGLSPAALARVAAWVASDEGFEPGDPAYLAGLYRRCRGLAGPVEAPDVLRVYAAAEGWARQVLLVGGDTPGGTGGGRRAHPPGV